MAQPSASFSVCVLNQTRGTVVCAEATVAETSRTRLFGLLGQSALARDSGLWIRPSSGVHTWGMRFPIDILALDRERRVIGLWAAVGPWRLRGVSWRTRSILELSAGAIKHSQTMIGDQIQQS